MTGVSTHILDTTRGRPAADVPVTLDVWDGGTWAPAGRSVSGADGRTGDLARPQAAGPTVCRLTFAVGGYLAAQHGAAFFPEVTVVFAAAPGEHYHLPLLLTPFGYSVYRGAGA